MLSCILAVTIGAEVTTYDDAPVRTKIQVSTDDVVVFSDGFSCPTGYVFKDESTMYDGKWGAPTLQNYFDFSYINAKTGKEYTFSDIEELDLPQGLTYLSAYMAHKIETLKKVSIPDSVTKVGGCVFQETTNLVECVFEHDENSELKAISTYMFYGTSLKALSIPDCITKIEGEAAFSGCKELTALYLPKNLVSISGGGQQKAPFDNCNKMYFVNEPFTRDAIPEKPTVYYFPTTLEFFSNTNIFRWCYSLNDVLVFGENMTSIENEWTFQDSPKNIVVFLGDMVTVNANKWGTATIIFANKADKSASDITTLLGTQKKIYCNAEGNTEHLAEKTVFEEAKCEINAGNATYCFCGYQISKDDIVGTALSHDHDYVNGKATLISINYDDISKDGTKTIKCGLCGKSSEITVNKIFDYKGYSKKENNNRAVCVGYFIDYNALSEYETFTDVDYTYGFVASANNDTPLDENANAGNNVIKTDLSESKFTSVEFILTAKDWTVGAASEAKLSINMYIIIDGAVKYITASGLSDIAEAKVYAEI